MSKDRRGKKNSFWGKSHTEKTRKRIRENSPHKKSVAQLNKETDEVIAVFNSISEAARETCVDLSSISKVCNQTSRWDKKSKKYYIVKTAGGFKWRFISKEQQIEFLTLF